MCELWSARFTGPWGRGRELKLGRAPVEGQRQAAGDHFKEQGQGNCMQYLGIGKGPTGAQGTGTQVEAL